jgi:hypothetical protein
MSLIPESLKKLFNPLAGAAVAAPIVAAASVELGKAGIGPLNFTEPWMLLGMGALPLVWWLLKSVPPKPLSAIFPPISLLFNLKSDDQSPARMPLWQRLLGVSIPFFLTLGLAQPHVNPDKALEGKGPIVAVVDNGWASGRNWPERVDALNHIIDRAEREKRPVLLLPTAPPADGNPVRLEEPVNAVDARHIVQDMKPEPWPTDREAALKGIKSLHFKEPASVVWLSDGEDGPGALALAQQLKTIGRLTVLEDSPLSESHLLVPPDLGADTLTVSVRRPDAAKDDAVVLSASDETGKVLDQIQVPFKAGQNEVKATFKLPAEVQNQLTRIAISGENTAGATVLLDERWRRRPVGLVNAQADNAATSLLSESTYIDKALGNYVDLRHGDVDDLLKRQLAVMILTDDVGITDATHKKIDDWVEAGGTVLRFAGPNLAATAKPDDDLLPVQLRPGEHALTGQMSGNGPGQLAKFDQNSPFAAIKAPSPDVTVSREVLAQAGPDLDEKTWARLKDGTPLVTAAQHGKGWVVLVHTTANTDWSNLALSDTFIDMLRAIVSHSQGVTGNPDGATAKLPPLRTLDGRGQLVNPPPTVQPLTAEVIESGKVSPQNPPGFYGNESVRQAHNLSGGVPTLAPLPKMPEGVAQGLYDARKGENDLTGPMLAGALSLLLIDLAIILGQRGLLPKFKNDPTGLPPAVAGASPKP